RWNAGGAGVPREPGRGGWRGRGGRRVVVWGASGRAAPAVAAAATTRTTRMLRTAPGAAVAADERIGLRRAPRAGFVARQRRGRPAPCLEHGLEQRPRLLDPIATRVERSVAVNRVEQQALVGLRRLAAEDLPVLEVERHWRELEIRPGLLCEHGQRDAFVRLDADGEQVGLDTGRAEGEGHVRRAAEANVA